MNRQKSIWRAAWSLCAPSNLLLTFLGVTELFFWDEDVVQLIGILNQWDGLGSEVGTVGCAQPVRKR